MTIITGLIFAHKIIGLSIGMLIADLGVGRVIAVFQHLFYEKMEAVRIERIRKRKEKTADYRNDSYYNRGMYGRHFCLRQS